MKTSTPTPTPTAHPDRMQSTGLAAASLVLGILSLTGFGLILGIPAIITGVMALRRSDVDRGLSWTGIITGAIATIVSLLLIALFAVLMIFAVMNASGDAGDYYQELPEQITPESA